MQRCISIIIIIIYTTNTLQTIQFPSKTHLHTHCKQKTSIETMLDFAELIVSLLPLVFLLAFIQKRRSSTSLKNPPPSPPKLPIVGNLHQLGNYPHRSLLSLSKRYGEVMQLQFGKVPVVVASSAASARELMKTQDSIFANRPKLSITDRLSYGSHDVAFAPYGEHWRKARSICVLQVLNQKRVQSFRAVREEETSLMIEKIRQLQSSSNVVNLGDVLLSLTNGVVCRAALGRKYEGDGEGRKFQMILEEYVRLLGSFSVGDYIPWLAWINRINGLDSQVENMAKLFDEFLEAVIQQHRNRDVDESNMDFVDVLLQFQEESKDTSPVEDYTIKGLIQDIFGAGTDTTSNALEWTIAELIRNPRTMRILQNEVRQVAGEKTEIDEDDLEKMPYLKAVIKEGLRLHSPAPLLIPREATQDTNLLGYDIARGTHVMINAWAISRDPSLWERPEEFYPERFLNSSVDLKGQHFQFTPFGAGRRGCPGITFALAVNHLALAKLARNFNFELPNGASVKDLDMTEAIGITVRKKYPLHIVATAAV